MRILIALIPFLLIFTTTVTAGTVTARLQQAIDAAGSTNTALPVVIHFQAQLDINAFIISRIFLSKPQFRTELIRALAGLNKKSVNLLNLLLPANQASKNLWLINAFALNLPANQVTALAAQPFVANIDLDIEIELFASMAGAPAAPTWNLDMINVPELWSYGYTGKGIVIASMDTGVDINHSDLKNKYRGGTNSWFDPYGQHATPNDRNGHGTQTMGIMVGGDAGGSSIGVAPGALWISVKIFNDSGMASLSAVHEGFQWLLDPDGDPTTDDAPDVVNNSWGIAGSVGSCDNEFKNDVEMLKSAGIAVVFSAGNSGPMAATSLSPANYVDTISVGAIDEYSNVAYFSSRGPSACENDLFPDVVAPGVNIKTAGRTFGGVFPNTYDYVSGTSFSAPHVAATIALIKSALPTVTVNEITTVIRSSAVDIFPTGPDTVSGYGLLDAQAAYFQLPIDTDGDTVFDGNDNCILTANTNQLDSNNDGIGNRCDADLNNDQIVDITDFFLFRDAFGSTDADADFTGDGSVDITDFFVLRDAMSLPPGPSAYVR